MLVSSLISLSMSLSFRLAVTLAGVSGDFRARRLRAAEILVEIAGEGWVVRDSGTAEPARLVGCRAVAVRLVGRPEAGRWGPAMVKDSALKNYCKIDN
jgi:hypothetical protein